MFAVTEGKTLNPVPALCPTGEIIKGHVWPILWLAETVCCKNVLFKAPASDALFVPSCANWKLYV